MYKFYARKKVSKGKGEPGVRLATGMQQLVIKQHTAYHTGNGIQGQMNSY